MSDFDHDHIGDSGGGGGRDPLSDRWGAERNGTERE
jgi:hypothetical protein